jgi:hypothetical protein
MKPIRLVCGTRRSRQQFSDETALGRSLKLYPHLTQPQLHLFDNNTLGLSTIYNHAIDYAQHHPAILVFIHDDVWLGDFFWTERVMEAVAKFDVMVWPATHDASRGNRRGRSSPPSASGTSGST